MDTLAHANGPVNIASGDVATGSEATSHFTSSAADLTFVSSGGSHSPIFGQESNTVTFTALSQADSASATQNSGLSDDSSSTGPQVASDIHQAPVDDTTVDSSGEWLLA
jgi:hypothetical protein